MSSFGWWLDTNSSQIQAIAGVAAVVVAAFVAGVAWMQMKAARAQATAANEQTAAAKDQASAAREQVTAAKQQTATALLIADRQTSPHISITQATSRDGVLQRATLAILNNGNGTALNAQLSYRDGLPGDELDISTRTLVVRESVTVRIDEQRAAQTGMRLTYETLFGTKYALEFQWNGQISKPVNERLTVISEATLRDK